MAPIRSADLAKAPHALDDFLATTASEGPGSAHDIDKTLFFPTSRVRPHTMPVKKRWIRISLRALLVLLTGLAIGAAWFANQAHKRQAAFAAIRKAGGTIRMRMGEPSWLEKCFGSELFGTVFKIDLRDGTADNALLSHIGHLSELQHLDLSYADIDDHGLSQIAHLPLRELWLQDTNITDQSAVTLSKIRTLDFLQLNSTSLSDGFLEQLEPLPELEQLGLRGTQVTGAGMQYLSRHPKLKELDVYHTQVDDAGVGYLVNCRALTDVGLSMTQVTNEVFKHLAKLTKLTGADLSANRLVTTEAVLDFEKSHPQCDIEWYGK